MANNTSSNRPNNESTEHSDNTFKLTKEMEKNLLSYMYRLKPSGANKHLNMMLLREMLSKEHNLNIPTKCIWYFLDSYWDIEAADEIEGIHFNTDEKNFELPSEFDELIISEGRKINEKELEKKRRLNDERNKRMQESIGPSSKSNTVISDNSKDNLNEMKKQQDEQELFAKLQEKYGKILLPTIALDKLPTANLMKSEHSKQNKNGAKEKVESIRRGRVTSDMLVIKQLSDISSGKRSCITKKM